MGVFIIATENSAILMELLKSVKYMVDTSIREAPYDKTVTGLIIGGSAQPKHYHVTIKGKTYDLPCYISNKFKPNTPVSVMVPENNMDFAFIYGVLGGEDGSGTGTVENAKRAEYAVSAGYASTVAVATETVVGGLLSSTGKNHVTVSPTGIATVTDVTHADNADNATNAVNATNALNANHADKASSADVADTVTNVPVATDTKVGGIKSGTGIGVVNVADDGSATIELPPEPDPYVLPIATESVLGGIYSSTGPGHVVVNADGTAVVPDAGGIKEIPIATEEEVGGVLSSTESGKLNVDDDTGVSTINDVVLIDESGKFTKPIEWGEGPWELVCTEDNSLDNNNGLPHGGTTGQYLTKKSDEDYDVEWSTLDLSAENITYDNSTSGLVAQNVQKAVDELNTRDNSISQQVTTNTTSISTNTTDISNLTSQVETNTQDITENAANIALHHTEIIANTNNISTINSRLTYYSNENLLDNWYFVNPVNQRNSTSYSGYKYTIDRWYSRNSDSIELTSNGVLLEFNGESQTDGQGFSQRLEFPETFLGKTFTLSILIYENTLSGALLRLSRANSVNTSSDPVIQTSIPLNATGIISITGTVPNTLGNYSGINFNIYRGIGTPGGTLGIVAAKLELGTQQTLAHQDSDGNWILNDPPPNYEEELAKCQRYYIGKTTLRTPATLYDSTAYTYIPTVVSLRSNPTITIPNGIAVIYDNKIIRSINIQNIVQYAKQYTGIYTTISFSNFNISGSSVAILEMYNVEMSADL